MMRYHLLAIAVIVSILTPAALPQVNRQPGLFQGEQKKSEEEENTRSVEGVVRDAADNAVEGAVVQIKDTKSLRVRSFITKSGGAYRFHGLSTNINYELKATHQDSSSDLKTLSLYDSRKQAIINLKLASKK